MNISDLKILVVDDQPAARKLLEQLLQGVGCKKVDLAADAQEAMEKVNAAPYDAILLDWHLPGSSGYHFLQTCREERKHDNVAFIIVSAESGHRFISEALKAGATSYIVKPFTEETLREHLDKTLVWLDQRSGKAAEKKQSK